MSTDRKALARDIWEAGVTDPDLLAEWLIRKGWRKGGTLPAGLMPQSNITVNLAAGLNGSYIQQQSRARQSERGIS